MEFKDSRTAELFEAAVARNDREAMTLQLIVAQLHMIRTGAISREMEHKMVDGLGLIITGLSPGFLSKNIIKAMQFARAMERDAADNAAGR